MASAADILARLDELAAGLAEVRRQVVELLPPAEANGFDAGQDHNGFDGDLIDTFAAQERTGFPADCIRRWCREENIGVRSGGRWMVSTRRLRALISGRKN
jgi:hypothetical protein